MKGFSTFFPKGPASSRTILGVVVLLLVLSFIPVSGQPLLEVMIQKAGVGPVQEAARDYLRAQKEQSLKGFLALSALKVGLAVLRSSEIGLILNVKIGDLAVAVYDYVNFGWKVLLAAVAYYNLAEFLLALSGMVDIWFVWIALVCVGLVSASAVFGPKPWRTEPFFKRTGIAALVFAFILYLGVPLAFVGAGWVSLHITGGAISDSNRFFTELERDFPRILGDEGVEDPGGSRIRTPSVTVPVPYDGSDPSRAILGDAQGKKRPGGIRDGLDPGGTLREFRDYIERRSRSLASAVMRQTAAYLFNIVVFPLLTLLALYWSGKYLISLGSPALRIAQDPAFSESVRRLSDSAARLERAASEWKGKQGPPRPPGEKDL